MHPEASHLTKTTAPAVGFAVCVALLLTMSPSAIADHGEDEGYPYMGAYWGVQTHAGLLSPITLKPGFEPGVSYGVSGRISTLMGLIDLELGSRGGHYVVRSDAGVRTPVDRFNFALEGKVHPLLAKMLTKDFFNMLVASAYGSVGVSYDLIHLRESSGSRLVHNMGWTFGAGGDLPLTDPGTEGWGLWLGLDYKVRLMSFPTRGYEWFHEHVLTMRLSVRVNDIYFGYVPRPAETRYQYIDEEPIAPIDDAL